MSIRRSRTAQVLPGAPAAAAMGSWGMWLGLIVLGLFVAGLAAAALYLHSGQPEWPPGDITAPGRGLALAVVAATVVSALAVTLAQRRLVRSERRAAAVLLLTSLIVLLVAMAIGVEDLRSVPFRWDEHAYTSIYWILTGGVLTFQGSGALMIAAVMIHLLTGVVDADRQLELINVATYLWFVLGTTIVLLGLVHLLPPVTGGLG